MLLDAIAVVDKASQPPPDAPVDMGGRYFSRATEDATDALFDVASEIRAGIGGEVMDDHSDYVLVKKEDLILLIRESSATVVQTTKLVNMITEVLGGPSPEPGDVIELYPSNDKGD